jgi:RNA polymerase sigma-70 factor (family 1)
LESKSIYSESELLQWVAQGNEQAFRRIFDLYSDRLFSYVLKITGREEIAEEIVMDAFMKVWTNREHLSAINRFDSYLYTIVRNQAFNILKRIAHEARIINELGRDHINGQDFTEETVVYNDYRNLLHEAVDQLPPQQKRVYKLSRDEGLKYDEIAEQLNLSKNTVKSHLKKAVSSLRTAFSNYLFFFCWVFFPG